jgi:hypothetical protein
MSVPPSEPPLVRVTFQWTPGEYDALVRATRGTWRTLRRYGALLPATALGAGLAAYLAGAGKLLEVAVTTAPWLLLALFFWFLLTRTEFSLPGSARTRLHDVTEEREFTVEGFRADGALQSALVNWEQVHEVREEDGLLLVRIGRDTHGTPLRAFPAEQLVVVRRLLSGRIVASASASQLPGGAT